MCPKALMCQFRSYVKILAVEFKIFIQGIKRNFHVSMKMEQTECSETSAYKTQMLGN